jgi:hypothetical protein
MSRVVCLVYIDGIFLFLNQVTIYVFLNDVIFFKIQLFFKWNYSVDFNLTQTEREN